MGNVLRATNVSVCKNDIADSDRDFCFLDADFAEWCGAEDICTIFIENVKRNSSTYR